MEVTVLKIHCLSLLWVLYIMFFAFSSFHAWIKSNFLPCLCFNLQGSVCMCVRVLNSVKWQSLRTKRECFTWMNRQSYLQTQRGQFKYRVSGRWPRPSSKSYTQCEGCSPCCLVLCSEFQKRFVPVEKNCSKGITVPLKSAQHVDLFWIKHSSVWNTHGSWRPYTLRHRL
jgi:hypothetical protein